MSIRAWLPAWLGGISDAPSLLVPEKPIIRPEVPVETIPLPPWLAKAVKELGVKEIPGKPSNPRIISYHACTTLKATDDDVPWCSAFVNFCMLESGYKGTRSAAARSWLGYGEAIGSYKYGCIVILKRGSAPWSGHVGFAIDQTDVRVKLLGGNQGNSVSSGWYPKSHLLGYRWPTDKEKA